MPRHQESDPRLIAPATILRAVAETIEEIHSTSDLTAAALVLAEGTVRHLGADVAGVTLYPRRGLPQRLAATDEVLDRLDPASEHAGPLTAPLAEGTATRVRNTASDSRWPEWGAAACRHGLRSALLAGIPEVRGRAVTLELYGRETDGAPWVEASTAAQVISLVGHALQHADRRANLEDALHTRGLVGEAQGILMERFRLDGSQAMSYLRRQSQDAQLPVRDLAAGIVAEVEGNSIRGKEEH